MPIIKIGLTGGIASGKSTIAKLLKKLGAEIIDADKIAHQVIKKGNPAYRKIVKTFGHECLDKKGEINRRYLGKRIFSDPEKRKRLNAIVHPEVFKREKAEERFIQKKNPQAMIIYDIPLLIETGSHLTMDKVILVHVKKKVQIKRLMIRNHLAKKESLKRIRSQMPFYQKRKFADYIIDGEENQSQIIKKLKKILDRLIRKVDIQLKSPL